MTANGQIIPYPHQVEGICHINKFNGRALIADDMGLGKTLQTLWWLAQRRHALPAIVVCPATGKYEWEYEASAYCGITTMVCEGRKPPPLRGRLAINAAIVIINYDILTYWLEWLRRFDAHTVVLDECHEIQNPASLRTKAAQQLCQTPPYILALSGTPLRNRPAELWPTINILWPTQFPSFLLYASAHCEPKLTPSGFEYKGATRIPQLRRKLLSLGMLRRRKAVVLKELPEKIRQVVPCPMEDRSEYEFAKNDFYAWLQQQGKGTKGSNRAMQMTKIGYLLRLIAKQKLPSVLAWVNKFLAETDEKIIVFAYHKFMIRALREEITSKSVVVDGSVTGRRRFAAAKQFQKDKTTRVCVGQLHAAGQVLTLTAASRVAMTEMWWRPGDFAQAEDRAHRIGQKRRTIISYLIAPNTIEEKLCRLLQDKQGIISGVLDGGPVKDDLDVFDKLMAIMSEGKGLLPSNT